jgi:hypothetical protein
LAFTEEGRTFALSNGFQGSMLGLVKFLAARYPLQFKSDPIP